MYSVHVCLPRNIPSVFIMTISPFVPGRRIREIRADSIPAQPSSHQLQPKADMHTQICTQNKTCHDALEAANMYLYVLEIIHCAFKLAV